MKKIYAISLTIIALLAVAITAFAGPEVVSKANPDGGWMGRKTATYEVTITNLTPGQPLTPPVVATHRRNVHLFRVGSAASFALQEIAENGNSTPMLDALGANKHVFDSQQVGMVPLVPTADPGGTGLADSVTFNIAAARGARFLSFASMLICTNDGFTGIDGLRLPTKVGRSMTATVNGYDAGTEINTEDFANMVPPCQGLIGVSSGDGGTGMSDPALLEGGVITHHPGIQGIDDLLPGVHGWTDPAATVTVTRVN